MTYPTRTAVFVLSLAAAASAFAGRPLSVDDANVNDTGNGHVESWYARQPGKANIWTVAPAYAPIDGLEFSGALGRDTTNRVNTTAVQAKWRITDSNPTGCNIGAVVGVSHASGGGGNTPYFNGLATCNIGEGSMHFNLGAIRPPSGTSQPDVTVPTWGLAYERPLGGLTVHTEAFGQQHGKPTFQMGARAEVVKDIQLDGTVGRSSGEGLASVGLKFSF